ncbi:MAG TPA: amino acid racemase [Acetobacteraceae bacterium]|nr:amino acid racemase [Acetobacteraceae bacterium]
MKLIGLVGGLSWEATALYYRLLNEAAGRALGPHHNARSVIVSVDFAEALACANAGDWNGLAALLADAARRCCSAGAEMVLLGANTAHIVAEQVAAAINVPLLHIADAAGEAARAQGVRHVGLIGTKFTLDSPIYADRLRERFALTVTAPDTASREALQRIIIDELTLGRIEPGSREQCLAIIRRLRDAGVEAIAVACTELPMLLRQEDSPLPLLDTTALHAEAAVRLALAE